MFEWKYLFSKNNLKSGLNIPKSSILVIIDKNGLWAKVGYRKMHRVTIAPGFSWVDCSCSYPGFCMHVAAILNFLDETNNDFLKAAEGSKLARKAVLNKNNLARKTREQEWKAIKKVALGDCNEYIDALEKDEVKYGIWEKHIQGNTDDSEWYYDDNDDDKISLEDCGMSIVDLENDCLRDDI